MDRLSQELLCLISSNLASHDLKNLRLVSKKPSPAATRQLFSYVFVKGHRFYGGKYERIIKWPHLARHVSLLTFNTEGMLVGSPYAECINRPYADVALNLMQLRTILAEMKELMMQTPKLLNVRDIEITFNGYDCSSDHYVGPDHILFLDTRHYLTRADFCVDVLTTLFNTLQQIDGLRFLSIENLPNMNMVNKESLVSSQSFTATLSKISKLRISMVPFYSCFLERRRSHFAALSKTWLKPASHCLTSLTLRYGDRYPWKYRATCDFGDLHFPKLKHLSLQSFVFTRDRQLDWVLSHGKTLEQLSFRDVAIASYLVKHGLEDFYYFLPDGEAENQTEVWEYGRRWSHYFNHFEEQLPNLRSFEFEKRLRADFKNVFASYSGNSNEIDNLDSDTTPWATILNNHGRYIGFENSSRLNSQVWLPLNDFIANVTNPRWPLKFTKSPINWNIVAYDEDRAAYNKVCRTPPWLSSMDSQC